jgi:hypothetical protein
VLDDDETIASTWSESSYDPDGDRAASETGLEYRAETETPPLRVPLRYRARGRRGRVVIDDSDDDVEVLEDAEAGLQTAAGAVSAPVSSSVSTPRGLPDRNRHSGTVKLRAAGWGLGPHLHLVLDRPKGRRSH